MTVLRERGEVYVHGHLGGVGSDATSWVERVDPESLEPLEKSPALPAGPFWPGGVAVHANGSLYVTFGRYCHADDGYRHDQPRRRSLPINAFRSRPSSLNVGKLRRA